MWLALDALAEEHARLPPEEFALAYRRALVSVQNDLPSPGFAPVASNDTHHADMNRRGLVLRGRS